MYKKPHCKVTKLKSKFYLFLSLRSKRSGTEILAARISFFAFWTREKWGESKKLKGRGWGRGKKGTLACKPLDFEKPVRPRTGLLIGAAWSS